ncbi:MAG: metallophosphoesterase [Phycisphaerales bacterium]|nr:metallophosphoesterase [Phycisphaerales bacterium]
MSRPVLPVLLPAVMVAILVGLWPAHAAVADESIGVLESFDSNYVGEWRIDGRAYVVETRATIPVAGPLPPAGAESPVAGQLVRVKYDVRDGVRYITWMQLLGIGPESVQDGPHLIWSDDDSATMITVVDGEVIRSVHDGISDGDELSTPSRTIPAIRIGSAMAPPASSWPDAKRILAVSDLEGNRETFLAFLQGNGVVNAAGEWIWGDGHLVLNGDIVDRGEQVTELLWMIRRLEREAVRAGGRVHYVLGNHESMVMAGDLRYIHPKYRFTTDRIGSSYDDLHGPNSELGRWLRNHNSVIRVGPFLFVHAGYSPELDRLGLELDEINRTIRVGLGPPAWPTAAKADLRTGLIWHQQGPHWYRGYFPRHAADWGGRPSEEMIASILNRHGVKHIVVGHTVVDEVGRIDGRPELIGIDVAWRDPSEAAGLLHAEGRLYQVDASGQKTPLDSGQSPTSGK